MSWVAAGVAVVGIGTSIYTGIKQKQEAKKLLNQGRPVETTPAELLKSQQIAQDLARTGLPQQEYNVAQRNIDRNRNAALAGAKDRKGALGLTSAIQQQADDAYANLDARNAMARTNNIRTLLGVNSQIGNAQQNAFNWNQKRPYEQNRDYGMSLLGAGNQNIMAGIDSAAAAGGRFASSYSGGGYGSSNLIGSTRQSYTSGGRPADISPGIQPTGADYNINTTRALGRFNGPSII